jgi:hypothetical protein
MRKQNVGAPRRGSDDNGTPKDDALERQPSKTSAPSSQAASQKLPPFHPLADMFPLLEGKEFDDLVEDIRKNGLQLEIDMADGKIIDGRNRARACIEAGEKIRFTERRRFKSDAGIIAFIISRNIHRRHLTAEQKRDLIAKLLEAEPTKSDTAHAKTAKVSKNTVAKIREKMERRGQIDHVEKRTDTLGRSQPASKPPASKPPKADSSRAGLGDDKPVPEAAVGVSQPSPSASRPESESGKTTALIDFAKFTIANIKSGHLKVTADVTVSDSQDRYREWRDLKDRVAGSS